MKLAEVSIRRPVLATVMVGVLAVFGVFAYPKIGVDLMPDVEFPFVSITTIYPGADPETIESKVVDKIEEAVATINGIRMLRSTSMESVGFVIIQFELEREVEGAVQDVRDKVSGVLRELPPDIEPPVVEKFDIGAAPILALAVAGDKSHRELTQIADEQIRERLQSVPGVGKISLVGGREREFQVWVDPQKLDGLWLTVGDVQQALGAQNIEIPGGTMEVGEQELVVKTRGQVHSAEELGDIIITAASGSPIRVKDIARVVDGEEEATSYSSLDGRPAIGLLVQKQSGSNTVEVADRVTRALADITPRLPAGVTLTVPVDNSIFIRQSIHDVQFDLLFGGVLAILIIMFFLHDWRATFISALALPISVVATFAFIRAMGFTFNTLTMLALSLSIGILIDDAIVVIENIHRHLEQGKAPMQAAADATAEIGLAVMATTASILAVFVPVATMEGMVGRFMYQFGLTVAFAVTVSLFVAFTLTPMLSARMLNPHKRKGPLGRGIDRMLGGVDRGYRVVLGAALRHRLITVLVAVGALAGALVVARAVPQEFMPPVDQGTFSVKVELPAGTTLAASERYIEAVAADVRKVPGVQATFVQIGGGTGGEKNRGEVQVTLVPRRERAFTQNEAIAYVRTLFAGRTDAIFAVEPLQLVGGGSSFRMSTVQFNIRGRDYEELNRGAQAIMAEMRDKGGYVDLDSSYRGGKPEAALDIDRHAAADLGVPIAMIAMTVRSMIAGDKITEIPVDGSRYDVRLRLEKDYRKDPGDLLALKARSTTSGMLINLESLATVATGTGPAKIERDMRQRQVTVFANLDGKALGDAVAEVNAAAKAKLPPHLQTGWTGMGDVMRESFGHLIGALLLAVIIVYLLLAAQFESFLHPFTIMLSLPLSLVGALGALILAGQPLGIIAMIGIILLMGLVTKNAILLVDYTNKLRERGMSRDEALLAAGPVRLRPILMTTAAMILGMVPVALAISEGGEMRAPMATAVIGGLITSTLLTLVVVPVVYSLLDRKDGRARQAVAGETPPTAGAA